MTWMPAAALDDSAYAVAPGDSMLASIRRGLLLVGLSRTLQDPASALRAHNEARALLHEVTDMFASTPLPAAQNDRLRRGIQFLTRALEVEDRFASR
jgi:hypothetical protein